MKLCLQKHNGYFAWRSGKIQVKFIHIPNLESGRVGNAPTINQQKYNEIQHLEPGIRRMAYNRKKKVRQMNNYLFDALERLTDLKVQ